MPATIINPNNSGLITIGLVGVEKTVSCQITTIMLDPSQGSTSIAGTYCAAPQNVPLGSTWALSFDYLQDWGATDSLSQLLTDNDGGELDFTITPTDTTVPSATGTCYGASQAYGGAADAPWTHSGTLQVVGAPSFDAQT